MTPTRTRFRPPAVSVGADLNWLLARAFGAAAVAAETADVDSEEVIHLGRRLALLPRILCRVPEEVLRREMGETFVAASSRERVQNAALVMRHEQACQEIGQIASSLGIRLIILKGMALHVLGRLNPGSRRIADLDVLVPREDCGRLHKALIAAGSREPGVRAPEHHLSVLIHNTGSAVEIHHRLDGGRSPAGADLTGDLCVSAGLGQQAPDLPESCWVPNEPLLSAHLIAHALAHHGLAPESYSPFRLLADLEDLGRTEKPLEKAVEALAPWTLPDVGEAELEAVLDLLARLHAGESAADIVQEKSETARLLRHFVAGLVDPVYLESLKLSREFSASSGRVKRAASSAWQGIWLSDLQVDLLYGKPKGRLGYLGRRLWRPIEVLARLTRYSWSWLSLQWRSKSRSE